MVDPTASAALALGPVFQNVCRLFRCVFVRAGHRRPGGQVVGSAMVAAGRMAGRARRSIGRRCLVADQGPRILGPTFGGDSRQTDRCGWIVDDADGDSRREMGGTTSVGERSLGARCATLAAHAIVLVGVLLLCNRHGLKIDTGVVVIGVAMLAVCLGKLALCLSFAVLAYVAIFTPLLFADSDKQKAIDKLRSLRASLFGTVS